MRWGKGGRREKKERLRLNDEKGLTPAAMKSHPEGGQGKCLPAGYKVSSRALNSGELHSSTEPCQGAPAVHSSAAAEGAGAASCIPALCRDGRGAGLRPARGKAALLGRHEWDVFPGPRSDPP